MERSPDRRLRQGVVEVDVVEVVEGDVVEVEMVVGVAAEVMPSRGLWGVA